MKKNKAFLFWIDKLIHPNITVNKNNYFSLNVLFCLSCSKNAYYQKNHPKQYFLILFLQQQRGD
jgi:hypothetical protein